MCRVSIVLVVVVVLGMGFGLLGCGGGPSLSKDAWKAKVEKSFPGFSQGFEYPDKAAFTAAMGKPDRTQTVDGDLFWYYRCSDGMIQMQLAVAPGKENLMILSEMNDY